MHGKFCSSSFNFSWTGLYQEKDFSNYYLQELLIDSNWKDWTRIQIWFKASPFLSPTVMYVHYLPSYTLQIVQKVWCGLQFLTFTSPLTSRCKLQPTSILCQRCVRPMCLQGHVPLSVVITQHLYMKCSWQDRLYFWLWNSRNWFSWATCSFVISWLGGL